jgi:hypothetical protein
MDALQVCAILKTLDLFCTAAMGLMTFLRHQLQAAFSHCGGTCCIPIDRYVILSTNDASDADAEKE